NVINLDNYDINKWMNYFGILHAHNFALGLVNVIPIYIYKFIFHHEITIEDVCDREFVNNLNTLETMRDEEIIDLMLTMSVLVSQNNNTIYFNLVPDGNNIYVSGNNLKEYINLIKKYYTFGYPDSPRYLNMIEFVNGFDDIFNDIAT